MKIIEKIKHAEAQKQVFYSFEFFPPKTAAGVENLHLRMERMAALEPLFIDVTWGAGGSTSELTLAISAAAQKYLGVQVLMHLTCTGMTVEQVKEALIKAREAGIQNILALRGDPSKGSAAWEAVTGGLANAAELVKLIREEHGDYFGIAVAGHPEGHIDSTSTEQELLHLKDKLAAGADFVITQFFYDPAAFLTYVEHCRAVGITAPIIPGIMPIQSYTAFKLMTDYCKTKVPLAIREALEPIKDNDEAVRAYGVTLGADMCRALVRAGVPGLHFYTLNLEVAVTNILKATGYSESAALRRAYPWRPSSDARRASEDVRPIHWANRPHSYIARTEVWDEFPNGRWGDGRSPAFGQLSDSHFYRFAAGSREDRRGLWGEAPIEESEIYEVFAAYVEGKIPALPWSESPLHLESALIRARLARINRAGYLTINSQPRANGEKSDDAAFGWGGPGGRVYQKAYVEFFTSPEGLERVLSVCEGRPHLSYYAVDAEGDCRSRGGRGTTALTWGVFPDKEVLQPTIFDVETFLVWRNEAFNLWTHLWATAYLEDSRSAALLHDVHDTYYLVAIIDNDFFQDDLWEGFIDDLLAIPAAANGT
ncbi:methylenetetrahydrofolate reductase-domain-containing protein [Tribonema minus]|uniref:Methylenetetrahydrofolate reductase-domain-containing protein n=1 Tax=Tribonema minus TaxID=303371 RepID=A0A835YII2_9STRA|nr:methylenetetrahydrofolate reductase-domain-containing protein [Tribonema minus]